MQSAKCKVWSVKCRVWSGVRSLKCKLGSVSFPHRHGDATGKPDTRDETRGSSKTSISCETSAKFHFRHVIKQVGMSQSATPSRQNDMTTCLENFEKERFCSFPYRHGDATGKPNTRDETRGRSKTIISCETSSNFDTL